MSPSRGSGNRGSTRQASRLARSATPTATSASSLADKLGLEIFLQKGATMVGLSHQQELVLLLRFGQGSLPATQEQVADALGLSPRAVEQIENEALRLLRQSAIGPLSQGWRGWDEA